MTHDRNGLHVAILDGLAGHRMTDLDLAVRLGIEDASRFRRALADLVDAGEVERAGAVLSVTFAADDPEPRYPTVLDQVWRRSSVSGADEPGLAAATETGERELSFAFAQLYDRCLVARDDRGRYRLTPLGVDRVPEPDGGRPCAAFVQALVNGVGVWLRPMVDRNGNPVFRVLLGSEPSPDAPRVRFCPFCGEALVNGLPACMPEVEDV